jgi:hypothetical protein
MFAGDSPALPGWERHGTAANFSNSLRISRDCGSKPGAEDAPSLPVTRCARTSHYTQTGRQAPATWNDEGKTGSQAWPPNGAANAGRLALRRPTSGEPDAKALRQLLEVAEESFGSLPTAASRFKSGFP